MRQVVGAGDVAHGGNGAAIPGLRGIGLLGEVGPNENPFGAQQRRQMTDRVGVEQCQRGRARKRLANEHNTIIKTWRHLEERLVLRGTPRRPSTQGD
jgi:hypothetical protein